MFDINKQRAASGGFTPRGVAGLFAEAAMALAFGYIAAKHQDKVEATLNEVKNMLYEPEVKEAVDRVMALRAAELPKQVL